MSKSAPAAVRGRPRKALARTLALAVVGALGIAGLAAPAQAAPGDPGLINLSKYAGATATHRPSTAVGAFDGNPSTFWKSGATEDDVTYTVDLGAEADLDSFKINWGGAVPANFTVQTSNDGNNWSAGQALTNSATHQVTEEEFPADTSARYIQIEMGDGLNEWGYEFSEFEIWGSGSAFADLVNVARTAEVEASVDASAEDGGIHLLANINDGNLNTRFQTVNNPNTSQSGYEVAIDFDLGEVTEVHSARVVFDWNYATSYNVQTSTDGNAWSTPIAVTNAEGLFFDEGYGGDLPLSNHVILNEDFQYLRINLETIRSTDGNFWNHAINEVIINGVGEEDDPGTPSGPVDLALAGTATASRWGGDTFSPDKANDGNPATRWGSGFEGEGEGGEFIPDNTGGPVWWKVDLGASAKLGTAKFVWDSGAADFTIEVSDDDATWTEVVNVTDSPVLQGTTEHDLGGVEAQFVRITMTRQNVHNWGEGDRYYGYSFFSAEVWSYTEDVFVGFASGSSAVDPGGTVSVPVQLNKAADDDVTVKVTSTDGTATAPDDYAAVDETLTITAGTTSVNVTSVIPEEAEPGTFTLTLSDPSTAVELSPIATHTVTIRPPLGDGNPVPSTNNWTVFEDFEDGWPGFNFGPNHPVLTTIASDRPDAAPGSNAVQFDINSGPGNPPGSTWGDAGGAFWDFQANWSNYRAASIWFKGEDTGKNDLFFEIKTASPGGGNTVYQWHFADDSDEWKRVIFNFGPYDEDTNPHGYTNVEGYDEGEEPSFNTRQITGVALSLGWWGDHIAVVDDLELLDRAGVVESFDDNPHLTTEAAAEPGIRTWGQTPDVHPTLAIVEDDRDGAAQPGNHVMAGTYEVPSGGWAGITQNFEEPQDWSDYGGIRFWWYASQENNPASPTAGNNIKFEIRTGFENGEVATLYNTSFLDNWGSSTSRWKLVEIPFSQFILRNDHQNFWNEAGGGLPQRPALNRAWGYSFDFPAGLEANGYKIDQIEVYGAPSRPDDIVVSVDPNIVLVDNGDTAEVKIAAKSVDGEPLVSDVTVDVATIDGSAAAGSDYVALAEAVSFEAGEESGSTRTVEVQTLPASGSSIAKSFGIELAPSVGESAGTGKVVINAHGFPYLDSNLSDEARANDLLGRMTLDEKIGQMAQGERLALKPDSIAGLGLGSVLSGGGSVPAINTPTGWADMVDGYQNQALSTRLQIPMIYGVDAVHGHSNVVGATILPHNIGLGSSRDPEVIRAGMKVTAQEVRATGIPWTFAPTVAVTRDERWGRSYESFGEDPSVVSLYARAAVEGLQGTDPTNMRGAETVLATAKHWVGDGGTEYGSGHGAYLLDQGIVKADTMQEFLDLHAAPYVPAIEAGVGSIMPSYSAVQIGSEAPIRSHVHTELNTEILKDQMGFEGFLISDWEGIDKVAGLPIEKGGLGGGPGAYAQAAKMSINSGMDMMMSPYNFEAFINAIKDGVANNEVPMSRIDDAVKRILKQKFALGLFEQPFAERDNVDNVGSEANRAIARDAAAKSQVLLKNENDALPLSANQSIYIAGSTADNLGRQMGGWTITWQGGSGQTTDGTSIGQAIKAVGGDNVTIGEGTAAPAETYDVGVVIVGERPYAEGEGDIGNPADLSLELSAADKTTITNVGSQVDKLVVLVVSGRPQVIDAAQLGDIDALVASWLPGSEGDGVADVLFGAEPFSGSLSVTWPAAASQVPINVGDADYSPAFPFGWGLRTDSAKERLESLVGTLDHAGAERMLAEILANNALWNSDGSLANKAAGLKAIQQLTALLPGVDNVAAASTIVTIARDAAVEGYTSGDAATFAETERDIVSGKASEAIVAHAALAGVTLNPADSVPSSNANAGSISVNGAPLAGFNPATTSYSVELPAGSPVPVVSATPQDPNAQSVVVTDATALPGTAGVVVTAANGTTTKNYTISFTVKADTSKSNFTTAGTVKITGKKRFQRQLTAKTTNTTPAATTVTYQWLRNGKAISGATKQKYKVKKADVGKRINVRVTFSRAGFNDAVVDAKVVRPKKAKTKTTIQRVRAKGNTVIVRVRVKTAATKKPKGKVVVHVGKNKRTVKLRPKAKGKVNVRIRVPRSGRYKIRSNFKATKVLTKSKAKATSIRIR